MDKRKYSIYNIHYMIYFLMLLNIFNRKKSDRETKKCEKKTNSMKSHKK